MESRQKVPTDGELIQMLVMQCLEAGVQASLLARYILELRKTMAETSEAPTYHKVIEIVSRVCFIELKLKVELQRSLAILKALQEAMSAEFSAENDLIALNGTSRYEFTTREIYQGISADIKQRKSAKFSPPPSPPLQAKQIPSNLDARHETHPTVSSTAGAGKYSRGF